jgi:hypothetical protein
MIDDGDCGAIGGMKIDRETEVLGENPSQIPHDQTRARTLAAAVGSHRLTAFATARPLDSISSQLRRINISIINFYYPF